jgi:hypothetical protein
MPNRFRRELLISSLIIGVAVVAFGLAFYFLVQDLDSQAQKIVSDRALLAQRTALLLSLADLKKDAGSAAVYRQAIDKILVSQDQLIDFPQWISGLARIRQISLSFSFQGDQVPPQNGSLGYINFSLDASGSLENLGAFLEDVEFKAQRFLVVLDTADLSGGESGYRLLSHGRIFFK